MRKRTVQDYRPITGVRARNEWGRFCSPESPDAVDYDFQYADDDDDFEEEEDDDFDEDDEE